MTSKVDAIKQKYAEAFMILHNAPGEIIEQREEGQKVYIKANVPSLEVKNQIWDAIKKKDSEYRDITLDIIILLPESWPPAQPHQSPGVPPTPPIKQPLEYKVMPGDTLTKIARLFYGNPSEYTKIFDANRDQLDDPNEIKPGQVLKIPD